MPVLYVCWLSVHPVYWSCQCNVCLSSLYCLSMSNCLSYLSVSLSVGPVFPICLAVCLSYLSVLIICLVCYNFVCHSCQLVLCSVCHFWNQYCVSVYLIACHLYLSCLLFINPVCLHSVLLILSFLCVCFVYFVCTLFILSVCLSVHSSDLILDNCKNLLWNKNGIVKN